VRGNVGRSVRGMTMMTHAEHEVANGAGGVVDAPAPLLRIERRPDNSSRKIRGGPCVEFHNKR